MVIWVTPGAAEQEQLRRRLMEYLNSHPISRLQFTRDCGIAGTTLVRFTCGLDVQWKAFKKIELYLESKK